MEVLSGLLRNLRAEAPLFYRISHAASVLDLVQAFAGYALTRGDCVRPQVSEEPGAPIAIKGGCHPLKERVLAEDGARFQPVDFFLEQDFHFQMVTGPNGGGKSTYLQTLAQLVVLAQIGCFIPAQEAFIRIVSSLFTRMGTSDCFEASASTFLVEMQEAAHILCDQTSNSLVLIDELGRGTSHSDGLAICWAVCEKLVEMRVYTLFATHFFEISRMQALHPGFRNVHIRVADDEGLSRYVVESDVSMEALQHWAQKRYGLEAAEKADLPKALLKMAHAMAGKLDKHLGMMGTKGLEHSTSHRPYRHKFIDEDYIASEETLRQLVLTATEVGTPLELKAEAVRQAQRFWLMRKSEKFASGGA